MAFRHAASRPQTAWLGDVVENGVRNELGGEAGRRGGAEREPPAAAAALEDERRPPERLGATLVGGEMLAQRPVRRRAVAVGSRRCSRARIDQLYNARCRTSSNWLIMRSCRPLAICAPAM
jgi:hypothetical protein